MRGCAKSRGHGRDLVAVAAPDVDLFADPIEELRAIRDVQHARAVFAPGAELHLAAQMVRHQLHPVANSQHRKAERKNLRIEVRRAFVVNAGRPARKHDALRLQRRDFLRRDIEANDLRIDLAFANPPRDDLGVLRTEIEDENLGMGGWRGSLHG